MRLCYLCRHFNGITDNDTYGDAVCGNGVVCYDEYQYKLRQAINAQLVHKRDRKMTRIIQADIRKVKRMARRAWHDENWWEYMSTAKTWAIYLAINEAQHGDHIRDTTENANRYYKAMEQ